MQAGNWQEAGPCENLHGMPRRGQVFKTMVGFRVSDEQLEMLDRFVARYPFSSRNEMARRLMEIGAEVAKKKPSILSPPKSSK